MSLIYGLGTLTTDFILKHAATTERKKESSLDFAENFFIRFFFFFAI